MHWTGAARPTQAHVLSHPDPCCVTPNPMLWHTRVQAVSHPSPCCITPNPMLYHTRVQARQHHGTYKTRTCCRMEEGGYPGNMQGTVQWGCVAGRLGSLYRLKGHQCCRKQACSFKDVCIAATATCRIGRPDEIQKPRNSFQGTFSDGVNPRSYRPPPLEFLF